MANALWEYFRAGVLAATDLSNRHREAMALMELVVYHAQLFPEVLTLAADLSHPVYEAVYALTAKRYAAVLLTVDPGLHDLCAQGGIESELFPVKDRSA